ncbi:hypothetical protein AALK46_04425 [Staphylococcus nepalensis]|uniref:hypothetical protein n=1 Tax=Staphylococcus nepalensis TaxID=214473 RepID=UPI003511E518
MTSEEYQLLENNIPKANNVSNEEYEQLLNEQVQKIANENPGQNQKIDLNSMPAGDFSTEGMSEEAQNEIDKLTRQKDFEGLSQEKHNDSVSEIMNDEINKN